MIDKRDFASLYMLAQVRTASMEEYARQMFEARANAAVERVMKKQVMMSGLPPNISEMNFEEEVPNGSNRRQL